jgi:YfiH family protein
MMSSSAPSVRVEAQAHPWLTPTWQAPPNVRALVTTRAGGVSVGARATLDLGPARLGPDDDATGIAENRRRVATHLPASPIWLHQVHGAGVVVVDHANASALRATPPTADAAVTRETSIVLCVRTADCLPVLLADRAGHVVGIAHAGWRGLAAGVLEATLAAMAVPAAQVKAWIGPGIGPRAFEVGRDVLAAFGAEAGPAADHFVRRNDEKWMADLPALARLRLARAGVGDVVVYGACTYSDADRFFSFRRERDTGRMGAFIWLAP